MKKAIYLFLVTILCIAMILGGCNIQNKPEISEGDNTSSAKSTADTINSTQNEKLNMTAASQFPIVKNKVTLTALVAQNPNIEDYATNDMTKYMEEKTNIHIEFEELPHKESLTKLNLMIASNAKLPDMFVGQYLSNDAQALYGMEGVLIPLDSYIEEYGVEIKLIAQRVEGIMDNMRAPDGKIYSLPIINEGFNTIYSQRMWIYKPFLDKLNLSVPKTTDELYDVLKAFKTKDPNGNEKADEIPLSSSTNGWRAGFGALMCSFIYDDGVDRFINNQGKLSISFDKPEWREGLRYLNKLCKEGLLDPASFTQDMLQLKQLGENKDAPLLGVVQSGTVVDFQDAAGDRILNFIPLPPLKGPSDVQLSAKYLNRRLGGFVISKYCMEPEIAYRWGDQFYGDDISVISRYGTENIHWRAAVPGQTTNSGEPAYVEVIENIWGMPQNSHWFNRHHFGPNPARNTVSNATSKVLTPENLVSEAAKLYEPFAPKELAPPIIVMRSEENKEYADLKIIINSYVNESIARFITGDRNIETEWDSYLKELDNMGLKRYIELTQKAYDSSQGK